MGHIVYDAVVATGFGTERLGEQSAMSVRVAQWKAGLEPEWQALVVGPIPSVTNGYESYFLAADGSKSGWDTDELGDRIRAEFIALFTTGYYDVVEIAFGGDENNAQARRAVLNLRRRDSGDY